MTNHTWSGKSFKMSQVHLESGSDFPSDNIWVPLVLAGMNFVKYLR